MDRRKSAVIGRMLVDTGREYTWVPESTLDKLGIKREKKDVSFIMANGQTITRSVGFAIIRIEKFFTIDEVVFAEKGDPLLLGARTLEGLNVTVDSRRKKLVAAGPLPAATSLPVGSLWDYLRAAPTRGVTLNVVERTRSPGRPPSR